MAAGHYVDIRLEITLETTYKTHLYVGIIVRLIFYHGHIVLQVYKVYVLQNIISRIDYVDFITHDGFHYSSFFAIYVWYM